MDSLHLAASLLIVRLLYVMGICLANTSGSHTTRLPLLVPGVDIQQTFYSTFVSILDTDKSSLSKWFHGTVLVKYLVRSLCPRDSNGFSNGQRRLNSPKCVSFLKK
jgi:hypothetical protein